MDKISKETRKRAWFVGINKRFRIPIWGEWLYPFIPQPRFLKRWYYRKSFEWWDHPSNHHWKGWIFRADSLLPGERDLWGGCYQYRSTKNEETI